MGSLLRPLILESCGTVLRERRRSSVNSLAPALRPLSTSAQGHIPVFDEGDCINSTPNTMARSSPDFVTPALPPLAHLHLSDDDAKVNIHDKCHSIPSVYVCDVSSPSSSSPTSTLPSRKSSNTELDQTLLPDASKSERLRWRLASAFLVYFLCGWGDGVTGTVLPYFMHEFHITYMMSSLLYAGSTVGFLTGTLLVESIVSKLGRFDSARSTWSWIPHISFIDRILSRSRPTKEIGFSPSQARLISLFIASLLHALFFVMMGLSNGFWFLFCSYIVAAFARSILTATLNEYFATVSPQSIGYAYGFWSFGGVASPLLCQSLVAVGVPWNHFYFGSLILSACNTSFLVLTYKPTPTEFLRDRDAALRNRAKDGRKSNESSFTHQIIEKNVPCVSSTENTASPSENHSDTTLMLTIRQPFQWVMSIFALLYCGCETATQGLMVSYLLETRHANPHTAGYVTSGFWGGITIGRLVWGRYSTRITSRQRKYGILGCISIGLSMQIVICVVESNLANSMATAIIGLVYGAVFPASLALANHILPSEIRMVSMALISAIASVGASFFPFLAGTVSSSQGIHILPYITVPLATIIACLWAMFPTEPSIRSRL